ASPVYSSSVTWQLLPPKAKDETPGRRGWAASQIHGRVRVFSQQGLSSTARSGYGRATLIAGGSTWCCNASTALMSDAAPAAPLVCPICDLTEPMAHHCVLSASASAKTRLAPWNSAASPALVAVPCASNSSTVRCE